MMYARPYQAEAREAIFSYFEEKTGDPLIDLPAGTGKSFVIADFAREAIERYPGTNIVMLTHVKELIEQNASKLLSVWPSAPLGIYSAGLGGKTLHRQITYAGIQSIHRVADRMPRVDLALIDECHLIPTNSDTMYRKTLDIFKKKNPYFKKIGFTASPFRLKSGYITEGEDKLFDDVAYQYSVLDAINDGYIVGPTTKVTDTQFDKSGLHKRGGEYIESELAELFDVDEKTKAAVRETIEKGHDRKKWLLFCSGVKHARNVADALNALGVITACITGDTPTAQRDAIIKAYKRGEYKALTNANVLTTGFDDPEIDLIVLLRPTMSANLYLQMVCRGDRLIDGKIGSLPSREERLEAIAKSGKPNFLVLDFARNIETHGPIDDLIIRRPKESGAGEAPVKTCPACASFVHASVRLCPDCGFRFPESEVKIEVVANTSAIISTDRKPVWVKPHGVNFTVHHKEGKPDSIQVKYNYGVTSVKTWLCPEHGGRARSNFVKWWLLHAPGTIPPMTTNEAMLTIKQMPCADMILVTDGGKYQQVLDYRVER